MGGAETKAGALESPSGDFLVPLWALRAPRRLRRHCPSHQQGEQKEKAPVGLFLEAKSSTQGAPEAIYDCDTGRKERSDGIASLRASYVAGQGAKRKPLRAFQHGKKGALCSTPKSIL